MEEYEETYSKCPYCGEERRWIQQGKEYLNPGTKLQNRYIVGKARKKRETDIIYIGWDAIFQRKVLIQEFFPEYCVSRYEGKGISVFTADTRKELFLKGLNRFLAGGKRLMRIYQEPDIVEVYSCFQENNTAYLITEYRHLPTLKEFVQAQKLKSPELKALLKEAISATEKLQKESVVHGNINEDNFWVTDDKRLILMAPEMAKCECGRLDSLDYGNSGPWTDVYGLADMFFYLISGKHYKEGMRAEIELSKGNWNLKPHEKRAIKNGLERTFHYRTKDIKTFEQEFTGKGKKKNKRRPQKDEGKMPSWIMPGTVILLTGIFIGIIFLSTGAWKVGPKFSRQIEEGKVRVPNLLNLDVKNAEMSCKEFDVVLRIEESKEYNDSIPEDRILKQNPSSQDTQFVDEGSEISVILSGGPELITVPDFCDMNKTEVESKAAELGFTIRFEEKESDRKPETVISQSEEAGKKIKKGSELIIGLSLGNGESSASQEIELENITGKPFEEARNSLSGKLYLEKIEEFNDTVEKDWIISQEYEPGTILHQGDTVKVRVSAGKEMVEVPVVETLMEEKAIELLKEKGLEYSLTKQYDNSYVKGQIISQSLKSTVDGKANLVEKGTIVELTVSIGKKPDETKSTSGKKSTEKTIKKTTAAPSSSAALPLETVQQNSSERPSELETGITDNATGDAAIGDAYYGEPEDGSSKEYSEETVPELKTPETEETLRPEKGQAVEEEKKANPTAPGDLVTDGTTGKSIIRSRESKQGPES